MKVDFRPLLFLVVVAMPILAIADQRPTSLKLRGDVLTINQYNSRYVYSLSNQINRLDRKTGDVSAFPAKNTYRFDINDSSTPALAA